MTTEREALAELVALEDMRLKLRQLHEMGLGTEWDTYHKRIGPAWAAARAVMAQPLSDARRAALLEVIQTLNANPYNLTKAECIAEVEAIKVRA